MLDKDVKQYSSIHNVFPKANVLLCWIQVLQVKLVFKIASVICQTSVDSRESVAGNTSVDN